MSENTKSTIAPCARNDKNHTRTNIVLIGFMGTGKSSVASQLHQMYHMEIAEMDQIIVEREGISIPQIFETKGDAYFRKL